LPSGSDTPDPVFIGGLRGGTTITCVLLATHSRYAEVPELQFHSHWGGLTHLHSGRVTIEEFAASMEIWYYRSPPDGRPPGLHELLPRDRFDAILDSFASAYPEDPNGASRALILSLVEPRMKATGKPSWVESTPTSTYAAALLHHALPEARFVHLVRDGRDSIASLRRAGQGPKDVEGAVRLWADRLRMAERERRQIPGDRFHALQLEDLLDGDRERAYAGLLAFVGAEDEPGIRSFFDSTMTPARAHVGAWRQQFAGAERDRLDRAYAEAIEELRREGVSFTPA
jgi:Sulfotransferase family